MTGSIVPLPKGQLIDQNGAPLVGATIATLVPGTTTPADTFLDQALTQLNTNPIITDVLGMFTAWAAADFRYIVHDANGNLIYDADTSAPLAASVISGFMGPVVGASNSTQFLDLSGTTAFVEASIADIGTVTGPAGPQGIQGPIGPQGIQGATGPVGSVGWGSNGAGSWIQFPIGLIQFGSGTTDGGANFNGTFPIPFPNFCSSLVATPQGAIGGGEPGVYVVINNTSSFFVHMFSRLGPSPGGFSWAAFGA